jgi:RNA ligase (TIGR02306 family)
MTDFHVEVVRIGEVFKHPNADTLSITNVGAYPVIFRTGDFHEGDLAVYVPVDSVVPVSDPRWDFLEGKDRIKAKKLRGVFSQGILTNADAGMKEGDDVAEALRITKYLTIAERNEFGSGAFGSNKQKDTNVCPSFMPRYTSVENLRRHPNAFAIGQPVVVTEKIEGENAGFAYKPVSTWDRVLAWLRIRPPANRVLCRSRNQMKTEGKWFELIDKLNLADRFERLAHPEDYTIYGESYGYTKGFPYNTDRSGSFLVFDVYDRIEERYLDWDDAYQICEVMGLEMVPVLYRGPYDPSIVLNLAEGKSSLNQSHIKEGVIVRSEIEKERPGIGRLILKCKGQDYLLRKE